jgi:hypothetical protein
MRLTRLVTVVALAVAALVLVPAATASAAPILLTGIGCNSGHILTKYFGTGNSLPRNKVVETYFNLLDSKGNIKYGVAESNLSTSGTGTIRTSIHETAHSVTGSVLPPYYVAAEFNVYLSRPIDELYSGGWHYCSGGPA